MAYYVNGLITDYIVATAGRLFPPAGGTNASRNPAGTIFLPTIAVVVAAPDTYKVTFTPTTTSLWRFDVTDSTGEQWVQVYDVVAAASIPAFTRVANQQTIDAAHVNTLQEAIEALKP